MRRHIRLGNEPDTMSAFFASLPWGFQGWLRSLLLPPPGTIGNSERKRGTQKAFPSGPVNNGLCNLADACAFVDTKFCTESGQAFKTQHLIVPGIDDDSASGIWCKERGIALQIWSF